MTKDDHPLAPDVLDVLRTAAPLSPVSTAAQARILAAVDARVVVASGGASVSPGAGGARWMASHAWLAIAGAFLVGGVAGALLKPAPAARVVYVDRPVPAVAVPASTMASASVPSDVPGVPVESLPVANPSTVTNRTSPDRGDQLAAESALLDVARSAIAHGEPDRALDAVTRHGAEFPHGLLVEEREALGIKALVLAGRDDEARVRATRFRDRYPSSVFLTAIDAAVRAGHP